MVEMGYWSPLQYVSTGFDGSELIFNSAKSEYTEDSIRIAFKKNDIGRQIFEKLNHYADRKHILVFVPSVNEAIEMAQRYPNSGAVYGDMPKPDRDRMIDDFRAGKIRVIFNVRVLSTGFDYTGIDCIILGISTASIALYYQIIGRATRIDPGKKDALIVDLAGNVDRFGRVEDIVFEKDKYQWRMFGSDGKLLSGIPIHQLGQVSRDSLIKDRIAKSASRVIETMPFGKHKGEPINELPADYKKWVLANFEWGAHNDNLKRALLA